MITKDIQITQKAIQLLGNGWTKVSLSEELGITRVTLDNRLSLHKWKTLEKQVLKKLS